MTSATTCATPKCGQPATTTGCNGLPYCTLHRFACCDPEPTP